MGMEYNWSENIVRDYLVDFTMRNNNVADKDFYPKLNEGMLELFYSLGFTEEEIDFLKINIEIGDSGELIIIPQNIVCGLWFLGVFDFDINYIYRNNYYEDDEKIVTFDKEKKVLDVYTKKSINYKNKI